ncbi:MAG: hydroxymethylbilane synthase [Miltoncostaeaceae bacterium]
MARVVLATRRSALARAQTATIAGALRELGHEAEELPLVTTGDRLSAEGRDPEGKGVFVKELERALLDGDADLAVHSAKDLPVELPAGLEVVAVPAREDPRDALVGPANLEDLPPGARVGTGSPRRAAQILAARPDLEIAPMRGNVDTRLRKLDDGEVEALVLAAAGLARLGVARVDVTPLPIEICVPAPGQGLLAIEALAGSAGAAAAAALDDADAHACLLAERAVLEALGGGCRSPIGAVAHAEGDTLRLTAFRDDEGGDARRRASASGPIGDPLALGRGLAGQVAA